MSAAVLIYWHFSHWLWNSHLPKVSSLFRELGIFAAFIAVFETSDLTMSSCALFFIYWSFLPAQHICMMRGPLSGYLLISAKSLNTERHRNRPSFCFLLGFHCPAFHLGLCAVLMAQSGRYLVHMAVPGGGRSPTQRVHHAALRLAGWHVLVRSVLSWCTALGMLCVRSDHITVCLLDHCLTPFWVLTPLLVCPQRFADGRCLVAKWHHLQLPRLQLPSFPSTNAAADWRGDVQGIVSNSCPSDKLNC